MQLRDKRITSWVAMDRLVEINCKSDAALRKLAAGRPLRSHARGLSDEELLAKLHSYGVDIDRSSLETLCSQALSAEEITTPLLARRTVAGKADKFENDWVWICLEALWQRWFPEQPSFEVLDDKMQAGYELMASQNSVDACRTWLEAWRDVLRLIDKSGIESIEEFDQRFLGTQLVSNWVQDLEDELGNAGLDDPQFYRARIEMCEEGMRRFPDVSALTAENRRRSLADSYSSLGEAAKADALFRGWLDADRCWGWGWIGWSDCYRFVPAQWVDLKRAEQLLREGLAIPEVRDRSDLAERLADLLDDQERTEEAHQFRLEANERRAAAVKTSHQVSFTDTGLQRKTKMEFGGEGLPLSEFSKLTSMLRESSPQLPVKSQKVGRNEPCPCGSGKKYKKCHGG